MTRVTYDRQANAAYIYLNDPALDNDVAFVYPCDPIKVDGMINLDFAEDGRLVGVEVLDARAKLPHYLLDRAEIIG
ncbi:DUF2283 domain-containing protein [Spirillospora sp. CA-294931]|uniref:DUF2283 domain-containing protein n=1 Tax=Spirillospora sp. CA-294931 TaxID=3240042 RepID=UPI003D8FC0BA